MSPDFFFEDAPAQPSDILTLDEETDIDLPDRDPLVRFSCLKKAIAQSALKKRRLASPALSIASAGRRPVREPLTVCTHLHTPPSPPPPAGVLLIPSLPDASSDVPRLQRAPLRDPQQLGERLVHLERPPRRTPSEPQILKDNLVEKPTPSPDFVEVLAVGCDDSDGTIESPCPACSGGEGLADCEFCEMCTLCIGCCCEECPFCKTHWRKMVCRLLESEAPVSGHRPMEPD